MQALLIKVAVSKYQSPYSSTLLEKDTKLAYGKASLFYVDVFRH
jgi:hypothetical protein